MTGKVKGVANATDLERIPFEVAGTSYEIEILKDPPAKVWNAIKTVRPGESAFDQDTRMLEHALQAWDLGLDITREAIEDLQEPVRQAMVHLVTAYYVTLQQTYADLLRHIYARPGGDDGPTDPTPGGAPASASRARSRASRPTR